MADTKRKGRTVGNVSISPSVGLHLTALNKGNVGRNHR